MTAGRAKVAAGELVPLADRVRYMLAFRVLAAAGVVLAVPLARGHLFAGEATIFAATAGFVLFAFLSHGVWRLARRRGAALFGLTLIVDGAFLAWAAYATGGAASPVRYLIVLELLAVSLLASYRTGIKLAIWQSLLLVAVYYAQKGGVFVGFDTAHRTNLVGNPWQQTVVFIVVLWVVAIATACFSAVNERELRRRRSDLEALATLTARLERESRPQGVADALLRSVVETFGFERALLLGARDGERFVPLVWHGAVTTGAPEGLVATGSVLELAARSRTTQLVSELDPAADAWLDALLPGARNLVVLPLTAEGGTVGALIVEHETRAGSRIERRLVHTVERFAAHGALALRNAALLEEVRDLAANDPLTGLANRMTFGDALDRELARARRDGGQVTLVMIDIDHFKRLNDTRGHQAGDEVLRRTAATLREHQRVYDTAARYGGEEFALIAPGLSARDALATAERIRGAIADNGCGVTASVGVATYPRDADGAEAVVGAADRALYQSKHAGRNTVTQARPATSAPAATAS
jgi:diguanylate cyclase (GGDEF)-like protein